LEFFLSIPRLEDLVCACDIAASCHMGDYGGDCDYADDILNCPYYNQHFVQEETEIEGSGGVREWKS
jgi:hypothetical protein